VVGKLEQRALSQGRKVVLIVDDEVTKYDDVFYPLMEKFHVVKAPNPRAAITCLDAMPITVAVLDLQMGSGGLWTASETADYKLTGLTLARTINERFPAVKVGILTGTRHPIPDLKDLNIAFFHKKRLCRMRSARKLPTKQVKRKMLNEHPHRTAFVDENFERTQPSRRIARRCRARQPN
jgi:ActR/RegA family two-component response regulator